MLTQQDFLDGGVMYWRVAVIDPDGNVGRLHQGQEVHDSSRAWQVQFSGQQAHGVHTVVIVTVVNAKGKPSRAPPSSSRAPASRPATKKTNKKGIVDFTVKPTRAGNLTATATKKLFKVGTGVAPIS